MAYENFSNLDLHHGSQAAAKDLLSSEALLLGFLTEMHRRKAFSDFECTGIWDYCHRLLKLGEAQSFYFQKVARKSVEVPELKEAVENGTLTLSVARCIEPVITTSTSEEWIQKAATLPQKELERQVQKANPQATGSKKKPFEKTLRRLMAVLGKSREEVLSL